MKEAFYYATNKVKHFTLKSFHFFTGQTHEDISINADIEYRVSQEGRDFVKDGENSGIYKEYPEVLSVSLGFCFIILQLFV